MERIIALMSNPQPLNRPSATTEPSNYFVACKIYFKTLFFVITLIF